jgi:hypothetical protein
MQAQATLMTLVMLARMVGEPALSQLAATPLGTAQAECMVSSFPFACRRDVLVVIG